MSDIHVILQIDNCYEDGDVIQTTVETDVPPPPCTPGHGEAFTSDEYAEWENDHILTHTGTGRPEGDAGYFVRVISSSDDELLPVGTTFEFV